MSHPFTLTLQQVDTINHCLSKAIAIAQMVADCGQQRQPGDDEPTPASLFVVLQVVVEQLEKIGEVMAEVGQE